MAWEMREPIRARLIELIGVRRNDCELETNTIDKKIIHDTYKSYDQYSSSLIEIESSAIISTALKFSERIGEGLVLRILNTSKQSDKAKIKLNFIKPEAILLLNGAEEVIGNFCAATEDSFEAELIGYDYSNILLKMKSELQMPLKLKAETTGDNYAEFSWFGCAKEYAVFRGIETGFKPMQYNLVAITDSTEYRDFGLDLNRYYYYRIGAMDEFNNISLSEEIQIHTTKKNVSSPAALKEIRVSVIDMHSLSLTFRISKEADIVEYEIVRSEIADLSDAKVVSVEKAECFYLQFFKDTNLEPNITYYYQVFSIDSAGNRATASPVASQKTPATDWWIERSYEYKYKE